ncbi:peripheral-type benzodiazepine receptor-associated protein 1 isoform X9 [Aquarana catesbeiana]|uniref:peripheral-type benzodiazepine receptor-associated protein 1 isoform X9 n=1 Tax=Aquarana catesbeiana TaxID=8400 RepID=UPI003CC975B3
MMLCMSADGQHSITQTASEPSEESWVLEAVATCSFMHSPLLAGAIQSQECDATAAKELSNRVVPLVMFSSCEVPSASLMDVEHPEVLVKDDALPVEQLMDVEHLDVALKGAVLPNKDPLMEPTVTPVDIYKSVILVDKEIGNVSAISASLDVSVTSLPRTKLQGITSVSVPTAEQEMPVCPLENGIRPGSSDSSINPVHTVCENEEKCNTHCTNTGDGSQSTQELLNALRDLEQRCKDLREENIILRKSSVPETEEKVKRLKRKNAELAVIAKRLEERAQKLQEANLKMVNTPIHLKGASLELCKKAFARQRAKDMREQASALLEKDKQIEILKQECEELQAKLSAGRDCPSLLKFNDFNRLLHESQKEVLRLQKQIALKYMKESLHLSRTESHSSPTPAEAMCLNRLIHPEQPTQDPDNSIMATSVDSFKEVELRRKRKECEILEQEVKKKQKRCEELEIKLQEVQSENERLVEENSRLCGSVKWAAQVEAENADLKRHLSVVTEKRDSALKENHRLHSKLENLEQVLRHMRDVVERRQQLEKDHEDAIIALQKRQEEVKRLQQAQVEAKKEHEGAVHLLENTLDTLQATVKVLEEKCRSQTEQFSLLSHELEKFRLQTGNIDLLTSTLVNSELPPPQCCSTPSLSSVKQDTTDEFSSWDVISWVDISLDGSSPSFIYLSFDDVNDSVFRIANEKNKPDQERRLPETPEPSSKVSNVETPKHAAAKEKQKPEAPHTSSKSESIHESSKSCPTPEVDTASEMEELEPDSVSINPEPETRPTAKLQVFLARYSYNPFDGPNENPEAELPLTAGEYIYIYGDMDDDGFYEGELMDGRRGLVPSNFVERVSDDDLIASHPGEANELSHSSAQDISFLSGSSIERSEEDDDPSSLSPLPLQGTSEGAAEVSAVPYPRKLALIKQLARSVVVGWDPPLVAAGSGNILSYNIYVDNELRQNVRCGGQTKALIEKLELKTRTYRISVQSMTENGCSDRMRCTMLVGHGYTLAPTQLRVRSLSATSAEITWQPCNSNYSHALYLNEESCGLTKAGTYWYTFGSLRPSTMYNVKVEARPQRIPLELPMERREPKATVMQLTTPAAGPPDAPLDVQVELGPKPGVLLITWLPVTIDAAGTSNGVRVTGYAVYADGQKVLEVTSPTAGSVLVGTSHLHLLQVSREISVRTMSPSGESVDSVPAQIPSAFIKVPESPSLSQTFSNSSLTCEQPLASLPSMPLISSSPCSLHNEATSTLKANLSTHESSSRGDSLDSLPVRIAPHLSPLSASSGYCQGSSSLESSEVQVSCQGTQEKLSSSLPDSATHPFPGKIVSNCLEKSKIALQSEGTALQDSRKQFLDTKESETSDQALCGLPLGVTWKKENTIELNATNTKEDCSSPETGLSEDAENTTSSLSFRGVSINDFLEVDKKERKESSGSNVIFENEDAGELPLDTHSSTAHIDHSRSSNLSDILEEEEYEEDEDSSVVPSSQKWAQTSRNPVADSSGKDEWNEEPKVPLHPDNTGTAALEKNARLNHLASDSEPDVAATLAECHQDNRFQEREKISQRPEVDSVRMFVALFDYDPETMSPNPDAYMEELPFKEGQILQVFGDKDTDGFYRGKHGGRTGYIPCNMVSELHIESEEVRRELLRQGHLTSPSLLNDLVQLTSASAENNVADKHLKTSKSDSSISRKMVAMFDYNPRESSPNMDVEAELSFTAGDIITVFGPMDEDGFFYGELNGQRGFVPSNYLEVSQTQTGVLTSQETIHARGEKEFSCDVTADHPYSPSNDSLSSGQPSVPKEASERLDQCQEISSTKKKKRFFSKGRKLFKKLGSSGKNL